MTRRNGRPDDAGFTLPELLVSITILGVIMTALVSAIIGWLRYSDATQKQLSLSHDVQLSAAYFARDVSSMGTRADTAGAPELAQSIQVDAAYNAGGKVCGTATTPVAELRVLSDSWSNAANPVRTVEIVAYYFVAGADGHELHRLRCGAVATTDQVLARNVVDGSWDRELTCVTDGCDPVVAPDRVTLTFDVAAQDPSAGPAPNPIEVTLTGQRRQS
jgi:prepilin-type N-terminal cleavage/methylation domain-containing protein